MKLGYSGWSCADSWKGTFNAGKPKEIIFFKRKTVHHNFYLIIFLLRIVNTRKHLGVYLNSSLDWSAQINYVCLKANRKLSVLKGTQMLNIFFWSFVLSAKIAEVEQYNSLKTIIDIPD